MKKGSLSGRGMSWRAATIATLSILAACDQPAAISGTWYAGDATLEFTRDGTFLLKPNEATILFQGMSGRWSRTEEGRYILVTDPLTFGNTATFTADIAGQVLFLDMLGQTIQLTRAPQSGAAGAESNEFSGNGGDQAPPDPPATREAQQSALLERMYRRWDAPCDMPSPETLSVTVTFQLNPDGTLATLPQVDESVANSDNPLLLAAAEEARSAVVRTIERDGPIDFLPADRYNEWKNVTVDFLPGPACGIQ